MIGPIAKISPESLPRRANIHWLGMKDYMDLPKYFAGWDVGIMPFALNDATRFISPTKTPEYLSSGLPVVSTAIRRRGAAVRGVGFGQDRAFGGGIYRSFGTGDELGHVLKMARAADEFLKSMSWDSVWGGMNRLIGGIPAERPGPGKVAGAPPDRSLEGNPIKERPARV